VRRTPPYRLVGRGLLGCPPPCALGCWLRHRGAGVLLHGVYPNPIRHVTSEAPCAEGEGKDFHYKIDLDGLVSLCKRRGFVFQSSEVYGGYSGFFDYGPLGVELKANLKRAWWRRMVSGRDDVVGLDSAIITNPAVHRASGHVDHFSDLMVDCAESGLRFRADHVLWARVEVENRGLVGRVSALTTSGSAQAELNAAACRLAAGLPMRPLAVQDLTKAARWEIPLVPSPITGNLQTLTPPRTFNLMLETNVGPCRDTLSSSISYLRPETAQGIFVNFKNVVAASRMRIPFGIAQIGKAFRNEITPRQFLFRSREFEQMEIEYFIDPDADYKAAQEAWIEEMWGFLKSVGLDERLLTREVHSQDKLAHYALACTDILFRYPFGFQELLGVAARGNYDLKMHALASGEAMEFHVPGQKRRFVPHVIEPSLGLDRLFLAVICSAYHEDVVGSKHRSLLRFRPGVAPITCGVFPLLKNKPQLIEKARGLAAVLRRKGLNVFYDEAGSIGRRYRRMDEVGTPFCCTVDFDTLGDDTVTVRDRDDPLAVMRVPCGNVAEFISHACELAV